MTLGVPEQETADEIMNLLRRPEPVDRVHLVVLAYEKGRVSPGTAGTRAGLIVSLTTIIRTT
ncbi:hypothetical protein ACQP1K_19610 [Sphaerimonospora sp. CA-214678]|uniref:hypothetical protein n=1 Tax=Sphaerimonospora sp. CA-214678 TaxID=3240029 RepID=UPI003D90CF91